MKKNGFKKILLTFVVALLMLTMAVQAADAPVSEKFEVEALTDLTSWADRYSAKTNGNLALVDGWDGKALQLQQQSGKSRIELVKSFTALTGTVVFEVDVKITGKGDINILRARQAGVDFFKIVENGYGAILLQTGDNASGHNLVVHTAYDPTKVHKIKVLLSNDRIFAFVDGVQKISYAKAMTKMTTGVDSVMIDVNYPPSAGAVVQVDNLKIYNSAGDTAMVENAKIANAPYVGKTISMDYSLAEDYKDANVALSWMSSESQNGTYSYVSDFTATDSYTVTNDDAGKWFKAEIIPFTADGTIGAPFYTAPVQDKSAKVENAISGTEGWGNNATVSDGVVTLKGYSQKDFTNKISSDAIVEFEISMPNKAANAVFYCGSGTSGAFKLIFETSGKIKADVGSSKNSSTTLLSPYIVNSGDAAGWHKVKAVLHPRATASAEESYVDIYIDGKLVLDNAFLMNDITASPLNCIAWTGASATNAVNFRNFSVYTPAVPTEKLIISNFKVVDGTGTTVENLTNDVTATLKADVELLDGTRDIMLVLAYYDKADGTMKDLKVKSVNFKDGDSETISTDALSIPYANGGTIVKGFIFDGDNLVPLKNCIDF